MALYGMAVQSILNLHAKFQRAPWRILRVISLLVNLLYNLIKQTKILWHVLVFDAS